MNQPLLLSKEDAKRALIRYHFAELNSIEEVFAKFRSIQFDPIAPVGCNHDLVLQARLKNYQIGDWQVEAYQKRTIYDGWDKQASLVPFTGWNHRRLFYDIHRKWFEDRVLNSHVEETNRVLQEIEAKGAMRPKDFELQMRRSEWEGSWFGPSLTKNILRALWHTGEIMTTDRIKGQHVYDLAERVLPKEIQSQTKPTDEESKRTLALDRHLAMGLLRPTSNPEIWSNSAMNSVKKDLINHLVAENQITPIKIDGTTYHAPKHFLESLDEPELPKQVTFIAPLDPFMWDRKMIAHLFDFDYIWEIYTPEPKRKWGYYVLPIRYGNDLIGKIEFYARKGTLEIRQWHLEKEVDTKFKDQLLIAIKNFLTYSNCSKILVTERASSVTNLIPQSLL